MKKYIIITALLAGNATCIMASEKNRPITESSRANGWDIVEHINNNSGIIPGLENNWGISHTPVVQVNIDGIPQKRDTFELLRTQETDKMNHTERVALAAITTWLYHPDIIKVQFIKNGQYRLINIETKKKAKL